MKDIQILAGYDGPPTDGDGDADDRWNILSAVGDEDGVYNFHESATLIDGLADPRTDGRIGVRIDLTKLPPGTTSIIVSKLPH